MITIFFLGGGEAGHFGGGKFYPSNTLVKVFTATSTSHRQSKLYPTRKLMFPIPFSFLKKLSLYFAEKKKINETKLLARKFLSKLPVLNERFMGRLTRDIATKKQVGRSWLGATGFSVHRKTKFESFLS